MAKVLISSRNGHPYALITNDGGIYSYRIHGGFSQKVKPTNDGGLIVAIDYWYKFVSINKERLGLKSADAIEVDKNSQPYYGFYIGNKLITSSRLTPKFVDKFFNYDCSRLIRFEPNTEDWCNSLGMRIAEFETTLFDSNYPVSVGSDATIKECLAIQKGCHSDSQTYKVLQNHIEILGKENLDINAVLESVQIYEQTLNAIFDKYKVAIAAYTMTLPDRPFDCGFTIVNTTDEQMKKNYQMLKFMGKRDTMNVDVRFPDNYFSCSQSHLILKKLKELSQEPILDTISIRTILD